MKLSRPGYVDDEANKERNLASPADSDASPATSCKNSSSSDSEQPLHIVSEWTEPGTTSKILHVALLFPSRVPSEQFSVHVSEDGCVLEFSTNRPDRMIDLEVLHCKWLFAKGAESMELYNP